MLALLAGLLEALGPVLAWVGRTAVVGWILRALAGIGIGFGTYKLAVQPFIDYVRSSAGGVSGDLLAWCGVLRFDVAITMILSALTVRAGVSGLKLIKK